MKICKIDGCFGRVVGFGWCDKHYRRWKKGKNPEQNPPPPKGWISKNRRWVKINGVQIPWARIVLENKIGRKLLKTEIVHHIDGDSLNDDPSNLEVHTKHTHMMVHQQEHGYRRHPINKSKDARWCSMCRSAKPVDAFYKCPSSHTGVRPYCKSCQKIIDHLKHLRTYKPKNCKPGPKPIRSGI